MFNKVPGYYRVKMGIEVNRYYVLSFKNLRKPVLLRFSCKTSFLAKRYIILKINPAFHEVIKGDEALERGIRLSKKRMGKNQYPEKYFYPANCVDWKKKKQHRTNHREHLRRAFNKYNPLKQFTIFYKTKTYTLFHFTIGKAFHYFNKVTGMSWKHFIENVTHERNQEAIHIKTREVNLLQIAQFNKINHGTNSTPPNTWGKVSNIDSMYLTINKPKPKELKWKNLRM